MTGDPVILEVAINGPTSKAQNPAVPISPEEVTADALACLEAGATIVHSHVEDMHLSGEEAADRYEQGWRGVLAARPDAILYPTISWPKTGDDYLTHVVPLARRGLARMVAFDPGSTNFAMVDQEDRLIEPAFTYVNSYPQIERAFATMREHGVAPSLAIYEPSFLRAVLGFHQCGKLPAGSFVKFYFGGRYSLFTHRRTRFGFGLPPTATALAAYLEMIEGSGLPWAVAVLGGDVIDCGLARVALEQGGHLRIGLEDHVGEDFPTNLELVDRATRLCDAVGRPVATTDQARGILGMAPARPLERVEISEGLPA